MVKLIDSHVHLFAQQHAVNLHGTNHPLNSDRTLDVLINDAAGNNNSTTIASSSSSFASKYQLGGVVAIEADGLTGAKNGSADEASDIAVQEYRKWLRIVHNKQEPGEGTTTEGKKLIKALVPWVPLHLGPKAVRGQLELYKSEKVTYTNLDYNLVTAVRYLFQDKPQGTQLNPEITKSLNYLAQQGLAFDVGIDLNDGGVWQYEEFLQLIKQTTGVTYIINHLGKPSFKQEDVPKWSQLIDEIAKDKGNTHYMKLSGAFDQLTPEQSEKSTEEIVELIYPWAKVAFDSFGTSKVLYGSDWPVHTVKLANNTYTRWLAVFDALLNKLGLNETEREQVLYKNTLQAYKIKSELE